MRPIHGFITCAAACSIFFSAQSSSAKTYVDSQIDSLKAQHKIIMIDGDMPSQDSIRNLLDRFYYDQFRSFQDPEAPYFLFMSRDAKLTMGIGGNVRMRGWFDWGGAVPANGFAPALIPMTPDPTSSRKLGTTPSGSSLFFRVLGKTKDIDYQLYIEANFNGYNGRDLHLKKAYAIINDWTVGYASSTFSDPAAVPATVDAQGPNNKISNTDVLIRWLKPFRQKWSVALSVETPTEQADVQDNYTRQCAQWLPDFAAFLQYEWQRGQHVRLAGILRSLPYRNLVRDKNQEKFGFGVQLSAVGRPLDQLTCYFTANGGRGIASLGGDLQIGNYDLVPEPDDHGTLYAPWSMGWCVGLQWNFRPNLFASASLGESRYLPSYTETSTNFKYGLYSAINIFWNPTPRIQVGAELDLGRRNNFNHDSRSAQRVGALCQFSF